VGSNPTLSAIHFKRKGAPPVHPAAPPSFW
jgi:hypothetical protein